jgi:hypothetical protein
LYYAVVYWPVCLARQKLLKLLPTIFQIEVRRGSDLLMTNFLVQKDYAEKFPKEVITVDKISFPCNICVKDYNIYA